MDTLHLRILTTEKKVYDDHVDEITLPTQSGMIGVRANHSPLVTILKQGEMVIKKGSDYIPFVISGGILEVRPGSQAIILADETESAYDININETENAYKRAEEAMKERTDTVDMDFAKFEIEMARELHKLKVARKWQK